MVAAPGSVPRDSEICRLRRSRRSRALTWEWALDRLTTHQALAAGTRQMNRRLRLLRESEGVETQLVDVGVLNASGTVIFKMPGGGRSRAKHHSSSHRAVCSRSFVQTIAGPLQYPPYRAG